MKKAVVLILALVMLLSIVGCAKTEDSEVAAQTSEESASEVTEAPEIVTADGEDVAVSEIKRGGTLRLSKSNKVTTLDPTQTGFSTTDGFILSQIYESLITFDEEGNYAPCLATEWEYTDDGMAVIFKLRDDVTFTDGTPFNAEAVKTNIEWNISEECGHVYFKSELSNVASVDVVDEYTAKINLSAPDGAILTAMTGFSSMMVSPKLIESKTQSTEVVGTGPFVLEEYVAGDHITLVANENYYRMGEDGSPLPYLDGIEFILMTDDTVKTTNLQSGDIDGVDYHSSVNSIMKAQSMSNMMTYVSPYCKDYFACFSLNNEVVADPLVRQAFSYAINREEIIEVIFEGFGKLSSFVGREDQWFFDEYAPYDYNPEKAKELLTEAGYPDGITLTLGNIAREPDNTLVQLIAEQVKESGITLEIDTLERLAWVETFRTNFGGQMGMGAAGNTGSDPCRIYGQMLYNTAPELLTEYQAILDAARSETDQAKRKELFVEFQKVTLDDAINTFICETNVYSSYLDTIHGLKYFAYGSMDYSQAWKEN